MELPIVNASIQWLDLTADDRDKVRRVLDLFNEQGTVDELGLGSLRDTLSNALFPGTSVLHTRLRYVLFIPWIYQELESWGAGYDVDRHAREMEIQLIYALAESDDTAGVIGIDAGESLSRLASNAYWALLVHWGLFVPARPQSWYHRNFDELLARRSNVPRADDPGVTWTQQPTWHPRLPKAPGDFPASADFELTGEEADFLLGRILERCGGTVLSWLAQEGSTELADELWDEPAIAHAPDEIVSLVDLARRFSLHVQGAPLLYNLLLAEMRHEKQLSDGDADLIERYRGELAEWASWEAEETAFKPDQLWALVMRQGVRLRDPQRRFIENWSAAVAEHGPSAVADSDDLRHLIRTREQQLKGSRARVINNGRLLDWSGRTGTGRMQFRWPNVRQLLIDLHYGLLA
ncbi:MAG: hypothetical protein CMP07_08120 [Xanthomonadales bacterium]|nr:hypothetical protein [Xanthomonadales bacterium]